MIPWKPLAASILVGYLTPWLLSAGAPAGSTTAALAPAAVEDFPCTGTYTIWTNPACEDCTFLTWADVTSADLCGIYSDTCFGTAYWSHCEGGGSSGPHTIWCDEQKLVIVRCPTESGGTAGATFTLICEQCIA